MTPTPCATCGAALPARTGRGRPRRYCDRSCALQADYARRRHQREARRRECAARLFGLGGRDDAALLSELAARAVTGTDLAALKISDADLAALLADYR